MRKSIFLGALVMLSFSRNLQAQEERRHSVSVNPVNLAFGTFQASYEYGFNKNMSAMLSVGQKFSSGVMTISGFDSPTIQSNDFNFSGTKILPEFRWYLQSTKPNHTGFFVGAYYRFQSYKSPFVGVYTESNTGEKSNIDIDTRLTSHTVGLQIGYKLPISKNWFADFIIAGPGYSYNTLTLKRNQLEVPEFYQDVMDNIRDKYKEVDTFIKNSEFKKGEDGSSASATFNLPAFRYGVSVGYRF